MIMEGIDYMMHGRRGVRGGTRGGGREDRRGEEVEVGDNDIVLEHVERVS